MTAPYAQEIAANLARAEESVQAAQVLMAAGYGDFAMSPEEPEKPRWLCSAGPS